MNSTVKGIRFELNSKTLYVHWKKHEFLKITPNEGKDYLPLMKVFLLQKQEEEVNSQELEKVINQLTNSPDYTVTTGKTARREYFSDFHQRPDYDIDLLKLWFDGMFKNWFEFYCKEHDQEPFPEVRTQKELELIEHEKSHILKVYLNPETIEGREFRLNEINEAQISNNRMFLEFLEQREKEIREKGSEPPQAANTRPGKLKWKGTQKELAELFIELNNKGFIEIPYSGELKQSTNAILEVFEIKGENSSFYQIMKGELDTSKDERTFPGVYTPQYKPKFQEIKPPKKPN